ncbi:hypothetical protein K466DRAFT_657619 [Polyporus arcularius HHB13444]|uniref:Uncharacterized protein n=1 Tax=Polyporus arcularius HHB13444 TaxID=1314778 RepID=A0A5C3Q0F9_9APHY|nr:hypothetical protein K466DRAFT_657619 [Polyporus arcularius HHB13444]
MDGHKRKRDDEGTVVTFYAPNRTFARVYKGQSLSETREIVRRKLGLSDDTSIRFARLHEGKVIELDDDDDFEAFRHLARYVTSLDVSVFVGQDGPPIFTGQRSRESSANPRSSKKRTKTTHLPISSSVNSLDLVSSPKSSIADQSTRLPAAASTVDANGVPKKKRRKKLASRDSTVLGEPSAGPTVASPSHSAEPSPQLVAKDHRHSSQPASVPSTVALLPSSPDDVAPSPADAAAAPRGSKRKRRDSPEPSRPFPDVPSPPRLPSKKKYKDTTVEDAIAPIDVPTPGQGVKSGKKGKRKGRDMSETAEPLLNVQRTSPVVGGETSEARKASKKAKKAKKDVHKNEGAQRHTVDIEPAFSATVNEPGNRKHKALDQGTTENIRALPPDSAQDFIPRPASVCEDVAHDVSSVTNFPVEATSSNRKAGKQPKSKIHQMEQVASAYTMDTVSSQERATNPPVVIAPAQSSAAGKKSKRRQTIQNPIVAGELTPHGENTPHAEPVASSEKEELDRKKSVPVSSEDHQDSPLDTMAAVHAAFQAIVARESAASTPGSSAPKPIPLLPSPVPARKRNAGKSKLSKVWGPDDLANDQQPSASAPPFAAANSVSTASEPTSEPDVLAKTKRANVKKARPSSAASCPVCEKAAVHPRSECPVVASGTKSLRIRISQLQKRGGDHDLIEELLILLKEMQRRRKTTTNARSASPVQMSTASAGDVPPSSPELPLRSLSTTANKRPSLPHRPLSSPRLPAGSEISEVAVESKDEGSSNESSSSDDEHEAPAPSVPASSAMPDQIDFESLLWGPAKPRTSILAQIPSSSESDSDDESEDSKDEVVDLEEEEKNDRAFRRMSRRFERAASSSDDEREPEPEPAALDMDVDDIVIPPTVMDPDPNNSVEDAREVEADVFARSDSELLRERAASDKQESDEEKDEYKLTEEEEREMRDDPDADDDDSDEEDAGRAKPASEREASPDSESGESHAGSGPDTSSADRGGLDRVERAAEDDPLVSQETLNVAAEDPESAQLKDADAEQDESDDDDASGEGELAAKNSVHVNASEEGHAKTAPDDPVTEVDGDTNEHHERELSPKLDGRGPSPPVQTPPRAEEDDDATVVQADVVEPHSEDPDEPIGSFSTAGDQERRNPQDAAFTDAPQREVEAWTQTPPPATPRTPRTVSRMKDRYGRLPQARAKDNAPPLSRQFLGDLVLPEAELTLPPSEDSGQPQHGHEPEGSLGEEAGSGGTDEDSHPVDHEDEELLEPEPEMSQDARELSRPQQDAEESDGRPRRTTRAARQGSTMPPPSSLPEPTSTPTPAPPQRGRRRLTEEEKAQREAEKLEKKAQRERKAAEKKAEREAKAAAKRAETEARKAAKVAEKEAKDAAQRALQEEVVKRGARAARGRPRGRGGKPVSTRSQRSSTPIDDPEEEEGVNQPSTREGQPQASETVSETPAVGKISWATLSQTGPRTQTESVGDVDSSMIDELQPSSPELAPQGFTSRGRKKTANKEDTVVEEPVEESLEQGGTLDAATRKPKAAKEPLFIPSDSQVPTRFGLPDAESTPFAGDAHHESGSEAEQDQEKTLKGPSRPRPSWFAQAMYPTLTDLASQQLFPATQIPSPALFSQTSSTNASRRLAPAQYGKGGEEGDVTSDDDDDDDSSDSDGEKGTKKSHIPQNRRAGAAVQTKKKTGLLSAYK